ncbi:hypothetical protein RH217_19400 [Escherichia coli]|uniref:hypothetical protein n=1 Tax=Escherichia coli TaxID=562 RepID=UPI0017F9A00E|nr:hypothetical protein [Escherichia coli]EFH3308140.1 hypothetical protein [Escherichia coli]MCV5585159.1 hypothetical protein [Escherichia coli]MDY4716758.1 hypothetical protein [Escherichia coli]MDY5573532.1 hypothetical protein [Escherichia coli]WMY37760.1 hypothetical protein RH217_19400 [Escherichia coli]
MATTPTKKHPKSEIPQLSYDCRRRIHRAQMVTLYSYIQCLADNSISVNFCIPYLLSYIHDDIEALDNELISLGLFDQALGKKKRR